MKLVIKPYHSLPCHTEVFKVNGKDADTLDFGSSNDIGDKSELGPDDDMQYGCLDMVFESKDSSEAVLKKYGITEKEYQKICDRLKDELSVGECGWCI